MESKTDWHMMAWRVFGYSLMCSEYHNAVAKHLEAIQSQIQSDNPEPVTLILKD